MRGLGGDVVSRPLPPRSGHSAPAAPAMWEGGTRVAKLLSFLRKTRNLGGTIQFLSINRLQIIFKIRWSLGQTPL